jgi:hypothetical protein
MMKFIRKYGYSAWLGGSLSFVGISYTSWELYIVIIPTILLVAWGSEK